MGRLFRKEFKGGVSYATGGGFEHCLIDSSVLLRL